jgi:murein DD-endopeptidase MepM/ murein hydrolase activator NlpD
MDRPLPRLVAAPPRVVPALNEPARALPTACRKLTVVLLAFLLLGHAPPVPATAPSSLQSQQPNLIWPVDGSVTSRFGQRRLFHRHRGVDIKAPKGTPVRAAAAGVVVFSGRQSSYGRVVKIRHANGLSTTYAHNSANFVKVGERVKTGALIGAVGRTGRATTNHLHFEVRQQGVARDPLPLLRHPRRPTMVASHDSASGDRAQTSSGPSARSRQR